MADYIICRGDKRIDILGIPIHILLHVDDIILVSEPHASLQHNLNVPDVFYCEKGFKVNLENTKAIIF